LQWGQQPSWAANPTAELSAGRILIHLPLNKSLCRLSTQEETQAKEVDVGKIEVLTSKLYRVVESP
jgi:hypothetical protein